MKTGIELIAEERQRQIEVEGFNFTHDDTHRSGELALAASLYAIPNDWRGVYAGEGGLSNLKWVLWPWSMKWWKPTPDNRIGELQKAGALIAAEIDRLQRLKNQRKLGL